MHIEASVHPGEKVTLRRYVVRPPKKGWAVVVIGSDGYFSCTSVFKNVAFWWSAHGESDFRTFLLGMKEDPDYFIGKLGGPNEYDAEATEAAVREAVAEVRSRLGTDAQKTIHEDRVLRDVDLSTREGFLDWCNKTWIDDAYECTRSRPDSRAKHLVEFLAEHLVPFLKAELETEKAST